jgi:hypothetical protein
MATTTATVTLSSSDLSSQALSISSTTTLLKAGLTSGIDQTTGLNRKLYATAQTGATLIDAADYVDDKAHKVYIKNVGTSTTEFFTMKIGAVTIGRLYGGDWMFIPYDGGNADMTFDSSAVNMTLEHLVVYELV